MRSQTFAAVARRPAPLAVLLLAVACSQNPRVNLLHGTQSFGTFLLAAQQIENTVCGVDPGKPTHCLNTVPGVTAAQLDADHQKFEGLIAAIATDKTAFDRQAAAWTPGKGAPTSLSSIKADVDLAITGVNAMPTFADSVHQAITNIQSIADLALSLIAQYTGK